MSAKGKCILLFFILWVTRQADAQQIKWSSPIQDDNQMKYMKIIGSDENDFYILRSNFPLGIGRSKMGFKSRKYKLSAYTLNMVQRWDKPLLPALIDGKILDVQLVNGRLLASSYSVSKEHTATLYLQYIDASGNYSGTPVKCDQLNTQKMDDDSKPDLVLSKDESIISLAYRRINKEENTQSFRIVACDSMLAPLFKQDIEVKAGEKMFSPLDIAISDSGDIYLLGTLYTTDKKVKAPGESFYVLYTCCRNDGTVRAHEIKGGGKFLTDAGLAIDNLHGTAVVAGFYSDQTTYSTAGVFYFSAKAATEEQGEVKTSPFNKDFLKKFIVDKKEGGKELVNYSIDRLLLRRDGGVVLAAESYSMYSQSYYDYYSQMMISHTYYKYGNILTLSVNRDGSLLWNDVLSKDHSSVDDEGYYSSYCSAVYGAKMYYIYNKYIETKTSVMLTSVSSNGEQNTLVLFNELDKIMAVPKAARQIDSDVLLLPAYKENQLCIARINF